MATGLAVAPAAVLLVGCTDEEPDVPRPPGVSPWSVSPSYGSGWNPSEWTGQVAAIGVANVRGFRVDSDGYDTIRAAGLSSTGILQWSPPGEYRFPVQDLDAWRAYVVTTLQDYPEVRQWEVWNEPPNFTADPSPASYAEILTAAHDAVKGVDPGLQVGLATKSTNVAWLREALLAGAAGHYDYVTFHPYERAESIVDGWEQPFLAIVPQLRSMLSEADPARVRVPVEFTEVGAPAAQHAGEEDAGSTPEEQARTLVKVMTMSVAQHVRRVSWYDPFDGDYDAGEAAYGLIAGDGVPRPSFTAYRDLISALGERPTFVGLVQSEADTYLFVFDRGDGSVAAVGWTHGTDRSVFFDGPVRATSSTTGQVATAETVTLGADPVILTISADSGSAALVERARRAAADRAPALRTARWEAGSGPSGLHVRGLGAVVTVDGRDVREPTGSSVQAAVGPDFDLAASVLRVTVVVRGVRDTPGFNLKYDADEPLATLDPAGQQLAGDGWQQTGTGEWRTLTWTLDDVRFAGMFGYNLQLDSDSPVFAGYQVASIAVEVLASRSAS